LSEEGQEKPKNGVRKEETKERWKKREETKEMK
jgi:hypothetical protein